MKVIAVTGFVPNAFPAKHFVPGQAEELGERLKTCLKGRIQAFDPWKKEDCWAWTLVNSNPNLIPSCANPPADRFHTPRDMAISNMILLQRYEWMKMAADLTKADVVAWIEYTVLKQRNVTEDVLCKFMDTLATKSFDAISLPGCWPKKPIVDSEAHWRFCGSCWVCPRKYTDPLFMAIRQIATMRTNYTGKISWDMNTMAYVELLDILPIRWYAANHDETQFTHF